MKLEFIYTQIITELQGISPQARAWSYILKNIIDKVKTSHITIDGTNYPEVYQHFPVDIFYIDHNEKYHNGGAYDEHKSGYDKNGKYCVYLQIGTKEITPTLNHELRHAFEDYKRISNNATRLSKTKEATQFYNKDFEKIVTGEIGIYVEPFHSILTALYLTSKLEESAYSETAYDIGDRIIPAIKDILQRNYLKNMDDDFIVERRWRQLKERVNIPILNKFDDYLSFIQWADKVIQRRAIKIYKKLIKVKYLSNTQ